MRLRSLIAITTVVSYSACAATVHHQINEPLQISASQPTSTPLSGIKEIDPQNPPLDGVWMPWNDAISLANYIRSNRIRYETEVALANKERDIANYKLKMAEKQFQDSNSPTKSWWLTWGFPIGISLGLILGIVTPIAIGGTKK